MTSTSQAEIRTLVPPLMVLDKTASGALFFKERDSGRAFRDFTNLDRRDAILLAATTAHTIQPVEMSTLPVINHQSHAGGQVASAHPTADRLNSCRVTPLAVQRASNATEGLVHGLILAGTRSCGDATCARM